MGYRKISIKLLKPTRSKEEILDKAFLRYNEAFNHIIREIYKRVSVEYLRNNRGYLKLIDKHIMKDLNEFNVEPFKDSLRVDASNQLSIFYGNEKNRGNFIIRKENKYRPIYLCRFARNREFSILKDLENDRYYLKVYLYNRTLSKENKSEQDRVLSYIDNSDEFLKNSNGKRTYEIFPLTMGEWQRSHLEDIEEKKTIVKSGELIKKGSDYYINITLWYENTEKIDSVNFLGVVRGVNAQLYYAVSNSKGENILHGAINESKAREKNKLHILSNKILEIAKKSKCKIVLENLVSYKDKLNENGFKVPLSIKEYNSISRILSYKSEVYGLEEPIMVSANSIFYRCTVCGSYKIANRFTFDRFLCVSCGHSEDLEFLGAKNISTALIRYNEDKLSAYYRYNENKIIFNLEILQVEYETIANKKALSNFHEYLYEYIHDERRGFTKKEQSIIKKLKSSINKKSRNDVHEAFSSCINYLEL